jgi:hypothetical protein
VIDGSAIAALFDILVVLSSGELFNSNEVQFILELVSELSRVCHANDV